MPFLGILGTNPAGVARTDPLLKRFQRVLNFGSMRAPRLRWIGIGLICVSFFFAGVLVGRRVYHALLLATGFVERTEAMRVTDPTGRFDAVVVTEGYGGAAGSIDWYIYIVLKDKPVPSDGLLPVFEANTQTGGEPVWKGPHVLEIHYEFAYIQGFRNMWWSHEVENVGPLGERDWDVQIHLSPSDGNRLGT